MRWLAPGLLLAACSGASAPTPVIANRDIAEPAASADPAFTDGALWTCRIDDYDPQPCKLTRDGRGWSLAKLLGSQRFRGSITFADDHARFVGEYFCPWGACTTALDVDFTRDGTRWRYQASGTRRFELPAIELHYDADDAAAFAGAGYGRLTGDEP